VTSFTGSQGRTSFVCDLQPTTVDTLIGLQWLPAEREGNIDAIVTAFRRFASRAFDLARRRALDLGVSGEVNSKHVIGTVMRNRSPSG